jgi:hypothetical protein
VRGIFLSRGIAPSPGSRTQSSLRRLRILVRVAIHPLPQGARGSAIAARSRPAPIQFSNSHADALIRCRARKPRRALPSSPAQTARAWSAERRHRWSPPPPLRASTGARCAKARVAFRRSTCGFSVPGTVLPGADGGLVPPRSGQLSPPFIRAASSHSRQPVLVPADSDPRPPGARVTSPGSGRRPFPASDSVLQNAPRVG